MYVPILKWKQGEQIALGNCSDTVKSGLRPLLEIAPLPLDPETEVPRKTIESHVETSVDAMVNYWDGESPWSAPFYIDANEVADEVGDGEKSGSDIVYEHAKTEGLSFLPVTGLRRSEIEHLAIEQHSGSGICVRLEIDDFETQNLAGNLRALLKRYDLKPNNVDLMIDLKDAGIDSGSAVVRRLAADLLKSTPMINEWQTLILSGCSFPRSMQGIKAGQIHRLPRTEWDAWRSLFSASSDLPRLPLYSDYAIQHPAMIDFDPIIMQASATIRYTSEDNWSLVRGFGVRNRQRGGFDQFHDLAKALLEMEEYAGTEHCEGCREAWEISQRSDRPGNLTTWRKIGTCHHLTLVTEQLRGLDANLGLGAS